MAGYRTTAQRKGMFAAMRGWMRGDRGAPKERSWRAQMSDQRKLPNATKPIPFEHAVGWEPGMVGPIIRRAGRTSVADLRLQSPEIQKKYRKHTHEAHYQQMSVGDRTAMKKYLFMKERARGGYTPRSKPYKRTY